MFTLINPYDDIEPSANSANMCNVPPRINNLNSRSTTSSIQTGTGIDPNYKVPSPSNPGPGSQSIESGISNYKVPSPSDPGPGFDGDGTL